MQGHLSGTRKENYSPLTFLNDGLFLRFPVFHKTPALIKANDGKPNGNYKPIKMATGP
jgi:hypothetical protein